MNDTHENCRFERQEGILIVIPLSHDFDARVLDLEEELEETTDIVFDFENLDFIGSMILGSMIVLDEEVRSVGGTTVLCNGCEAIFDSLRTSRLDTLFRHFPSRAEAVQFLRS